MSVSRENDIPFPHVIVDDLVRYAGEVPITPGTFAPFPLFDDKEADRAPFEHERMYQDALSTYAFRGINIGRRSVGHGAYTFMSSILIDQAEEQIREHIKNEKKRNEVIVGAAYNLLELLEGRQEEEEMAGRIDRLADGKASVLDKAILVSTFPNEFPSLELMNCRRYFDVSAMARADSVADANISDLVAADFSTSPIGTREKKDVPVGYGLKSRSKKVLTAISPPSGVPLVESRLIVEAVVPTETGEAYILRQLASQYLHVDERKLN